MLAKVSLPPWVARFSIRPVSGYLYGVYAQGRGWPCQQKLVCRLWVSVIQFHVAGLYPAEFCDEQVDAQA